MDSFAIDPPELPEAEKPVGNFFDQFIDAKPAVPVEVEQSGPDPILIEAQKALQAKKTDPLAGTRYSGLSDDEFTAAPLPSAQDSLQSAQDSQGYDRHGRPVADPATHDFSEPAMTQKEAMAFRAREALRKSAERRKLIKRKELGKAIGNTASGNAKLGFAEGAIGAADSFGALARQFDETVLQRMTDGKPTLLSDIGQFVTDEAEEARGSLPAMDVAALRDIRSIDDLMAYAVRKGTQGATTMLPMFVAGPSAGVAMGIGEMRSSLEEEFEKAGKPLDRETAERYSIGFGTAIGMLDVYSFGVLTKFSAEAKREIVSNAATAFAKKVATKGATEALTEALQEGIQATASRHGAGTLDWSDTLPILEQMAEGAFAGKVTGAGMSAPGAVIETAQGMQGTREAVERGKGLVTPGSEETASGAKNGASEVLPPPITDAGEQIASGVEVIAEETGVAQAVRDIVAQLDPEAIEEMRGNLQESNPDLAATLDAVATELGLVEESNPVAELGDTETVLDMWRFVNEMKRHPKPMGLAEYVKQNGGLIDEGGDVGAATGGAKGRPALASRGGMTLDDAALMAWEAGYFQTSERPDINTFLDAIDQDLRGDPVYTSDGRDLADNLQIAREMEIDLEDYNLSGIRSEVRARETLGARAGDGVATESGTGTQDNAGPQGRTVENVTQPRRSLKSDDVAAMSVSEFEDTIIEDVTPIPGRTGRSREQNFTPSAAQIETPEFRAFFEGSTVVDESGKPQVFYHGTSPVNAIGQNADFESFNPLSHFGTSKAANERLSNGQFNDGSGQRVIPVYLNIKRPLEIEDNGQHSAESIALDLGDKGVIDYQTAENIADIGPSRAQDEALADAVEAKGYDGFIYSNTYEDVGSTSYIALRPEQIKSATGNRGSFDPADPRTAFQKGGETGATTSTDQIKSAVVEAAKILPKSARVRVAKTIEGMGGGKGQVTPSLTVADVKDGTWPVGRDVKAFHGTPASLSSVSQIRRPKSSLGMFFGAEDAADAFGGGKRLEVVLNLRNPLILSRGEKIDPTFLRAALKNGEFSGAYDEQVQALKDSRGRAIKANEEEIARLNEAETDADIMTVARTVLRRHDVDAVVSTDPSISSKQEIAVIDPRSVRDADQGWKGDYFEPPRQHPADALAAPRPASDEIAARRVSYEQLKTRLDEINKIQEDHIAAKNWAALDETMPEREALFGKLDIERKWFREHGMQPEKSSFQQDANITGRFDPAYPSSGTPLERTIWLSTQSQNPKQTLGHEGVHALRDMDLFTKSEWNILGQAAKQEGWLEKYKIDKRYPDLTPAQKAEEAAAEAYGDWFVNPKAIKNQGAKNLFERIKRFLAAINKSIRKSLGKADNEPVTFEDIFGRIESGEVAARAGEGLGASIGAPDVTVPEGTAPTILNNALPKTGELPDSLSRDEIRSNDLWSHDSEPTSKRLSEIVADLNDALGLTVRQGRTTRSVRVDGEKLTVSGTHNTGTGVTRIHAQNDIDTLAHEGGHHLEMRMGQPLQDLISTNTNELVALSTPEGPDVREGFAEFFRRYVTNRQAAVNAAPQFYGAFEGLLLNYPEFHQKLENVESAYQAWLAAPSDNVIVEDMVTTAAKSTMDRVKEALGADGLTKMKVGDKAYTSLVDNLHPIKVAVRQLIEIAENNNRTLPKLKAVTNPYKLYRLARDAYASGHMDIIHGVRMSGETGISSPSLKDALDEAYMGDWSEANTRRFGAYLTSRRVLREWVRFRAGEITNPPDKFSETDHKDVIQRIEAENPQFVAAAEKVHTWSKWLLAKKFKAGFITQETYNDLLSREDYVPLMRDMSDNGGGPAGPGKGKNGKQGMIQRFRGSSRDIINPLESLVKDAYETSGMIARNDALRALVRLAEAAGHGGGAIAERLPERAWKSQNVDVMEALKSAAREAGVDPAEAQVMIASADAALGDNKVATLWRAGDISENGEPIVYMWEEGKRIPIRLPDQEFGADMFEAITGMSKEWSGVFTSMLALPTRWLRAGITTSPDFIVANIMRDFASSWVLTDGYNPLKGSARGVRSAIARDEWSRLYSSFGGLMGGQEVATLQEGAIKREVTRLKRRGIKIKSWKDAKDLGRDILSITEGSETATRVGLFRHHYERAIADGLTEAEAAAEAAFGARDYIDFGRYGSKMMAARRLVTFLNAALQGLDKTARVLGANTDSGSAYRKLVEPYIRHRAGAPLTEAERAAIGQSAQAWAKLTSLGIVGLALSLLYKDDEEYEEIGDYIRDTHWVFKDHTGTWRRIPKPFELAFVSNIVERAFEMGYKDDPTAMDRLTEGLYRITAPPGFGPDDKMGPMSAIPGLSVTAELAFNYDSFRDGPIVPNHLMKLPPSMRFDAYTSNFSKLVAEQLGASPAMIDHAIKGVFGSWGREALNLSNQFSKNREDTAATDYFMLRRFSKDHTKGSTSVAGFWDQMSQNSGHLMQAASGYKELSEHAGEAQAADFLKSLTDDQKAFALLHTHFNTETRRMHPLNRAQIMMRASSAVRREMILGHLTKTDGTPLVLSPKQQRQVHDTLSDLSMREARNALVVMGAPGWVGKKLMNTERLLEELQATSLQLAVNYRKRLQFKNGRPKVYDFAKIQELWPQARAELLENGASARLSTLAARAKASRDYAY